ncbi:uncharacterized protein LOC114525893 [Dendronephthya gigantea]|uniref:uncharacterized protein LOC114525893 n=1 Tax=Dendronephthya gigantea TaxID=151771 RepID=UPI00106C5246|nr:uncharacterized protein LOC114525893 [Dendronephthya gigantea]
MSGLPWDSEERQNYIRALYIVTWAVRKELRKFFIQEWNKLYQASLGAWDDTNVSGQELFNLEKKRTRPNLKFLHSKFQKGNTNEWDCTVLFGAILYSNSIGCNLKSHQKNELDTLRKLRNEIIHEIPDKKLTDKDFQTMTTEVKNALRSLGLSINEVVRIKNLFASFKILPLSPALEVVSPSDKIHKIREDLENLRSDNDGKLTYFYISGNPGSGKSQLASQVCEDIWKNVHAKHEAMFVMTLNGKDLDSLLYSYEDFCRKLNCNESVLKRFSRSSKPKDEKIKDLRSQISNRIKNWKKWWIIVDNVEDLELISPLLPLMGDDVWNNGQIIVTTQNTNAVPSDSLSSKHISLAAKMSGIPWESEERQNSIRADYIVSDVVRKELRNFFIQEWNKRYQASLGAWDDTNVSGSQLFNLEKKRTRPNKTMLQSKFNHGDTNDWDCTVLFDAILFSNAIGASLNPTPKTEIDNLRKLRNELAHKPKKTLDDADFQTKTTNVINALNALGLSSNEVVRIKNLYKSFQILPPKPTHEVVSRSDKIHEIREDLEKLRSDNDGKLTYFYISGNPGSGKSQLARQVCKDICEDVHVKDEAMFVMTLKGKDLNSLLYSYEDFSRKLNCNESVLKDLLSSSKAKDEKIKDLRSQISNRIKNWKKWWIIVDNVENLELISPLLPLIGGDVWNNGQIIVTTQNTNAVPSDSLSSKHISLSLGMNDQECRQLLALLSRTDVNDSLLDEVAEKLDRQPLAMAAAAVYMGQVIESLPDFSWRDYLEKLEKGRRELTEERLRQTNSAAYSSTMSAAVLLAVTKCAKENKILGHAFNLFSLISFEPLPLDLVVKYVQQQEDEFEAEDIILAIKHCSLFVHVGNKDRDIRLHRVVHDAIKFRYLLKKTDIGDSSKDEIPDEEQNVRIGIHNVTRTLYSFEDRKDKIKIIPHLKAFLTEINRLFPNQTLSLTSIL